MTRRGRHRAAALSNGVVIAVILLGCGSSDSDTSAPLSKGQYLKQANKICKKGGEAKDQAVKRGLEEIPPKELKGGPKPKYVKMLSEKALPYFQKAVTELAELEPPAKDKATVDKFIANLEAASARAEAEPLVIAEVDPFNKAAEGARDYGLEDCIL